MRALGWCTFVRPPARPHALQLYPWGSARDSAALTHPTPHRTLATHPLWLSPHTRPLFQPLSTGPARVWRGAVRTASREGRSCRGTGPQVRWYDWRGRISVMPLGRGKGTCMCWGRVDRLEARNRGCRGHSLQGHPCVCDDEAGGEKGEVLNATGSRPARGPWT